MAFVYHFYENKLNFIEATPETLDALTLRFPAGLYTTFRTYTNGTKAIGLRSHIFRLALEEGEESLLRRSLLDAIQGIQRKSAEWKIRVYRETDKVSDWWIMIEPFSPVSAELRSKGIRVNLSTVSRENPTIKSTRFIQKSIDERADNKNSGIYESLICVNGLIREGFTSNFFYVSGGKLMTAKQNILKGVTRSTVLSLADEIGISVGFKALRVRDLGLVSEAFICSSSRGVVTISELVTNEGNYQWGRGAITTRLDKAYQDHESSLSEPIGSF